MQSSEDGWLQNNERKPSFHFMVLSKQASEGVMDLRNLFETQLNEKNKLHQCGSGIASELCACIGSGLTAGDRYDASHNYEGESRAADKLCMD